MPTPPKGEVCSIYLKLDDFGYIKEFDENGLLYSRGICAPLVERKPRNEKEFIELIEKIRGFNQTIILNPDYTYDIPLNLMHKYIALSPSTWFDIVSYIKKLKSRLKDK